MKAKDMAAKANAAEDRLEAVKGILFDEIKSVAEVAKARGVKTNAGLLAVIRETNDRWLAFCRLCPDVNPASFKSNLHELVPSSKQIWP